MLTTVVHLVIILLVIGFILWLINNYIPIQPPFKQIVNVVIIVAVVIWLVSKFLPLLHL